MQVANIDCIKYHNQTKNKFYLFFLGKPYLSNFARSYSRLSVHFYNLLYKMSPGLDFGLILFKSIYKLLLMRISNEAIRELREKLPLGSIQKIEDRLAKKSLSFSKQYIYRCLDPERDDYNEDIIDEAISVCEEASATRLAREKRISDIIMSFLCGPLVPCLCLINA